MFRPPGQRWYHICYIHMYLSSLSSAGVNKAWIGFSGPQGDVSSFKWVDCTPVVYQDWHPREPNSREGCTTAHNDKSWRGQRCTSRRPAICETPGSYDWLISVPVTVLNNKARHIILSVVYCAAVTALSYQHFPPLSIVYAA